ncbi:MAG: hypothetical protein DMF57_05205 [Acidobacteria bacterium]|nr:MAG: hypothetical protein DMF57_05205 [Acidobacteriota bacterium]
MNCAGCGAPLPDETAECAACNDPTGRTLVMDPHRRRHAITAVKLFAIAAFFGVGLISQLNERFGDFRDSLGSALLYVIGGIAAFILLRKLFARGDERL